jgi:F-type H+-transporting ATPase subunit a
LFQPFDDKKVAEAAGAVEQAAHSGAAHAADAAHAAEHAADAVVTFEAAKAHYFDPGHLFHHVQDGTYFEVPRFLGEKWHIPQFSPLQLLNQLKWGDKPIFDGQITKFMILELAAAVLIILGFMWLAKKIQSGATPRGRVWNFLEVFVLFVRDEIARPNIGKKDSDKFLPFLLTLFFFILVLNLFGMIPFLGSATGAIAVTAVFALAVFVVVVGSGMKKMGVLGFVQAQVPHMDLPAAIGVVLKPGLLVLELFGLFIKHFVLCVRLFANMFAGHLVLAVFLGLIGAAGAVTGSYLIYGVAPAVVLASIALSLLELFVAFLQAYVFTYLAALFIGSAQHAH